jgi:glyoxylase-like metal-dependent hydrolase (beta-lactamase superfamily II)
MSKRRVVVMSVVSLVAACAGSAGALSQCQPTSHVAAPAALGSARAASELEAIVDQPGPVDVETVIGADWEVPLSGMVNLEHPRAKAAGLTDHPERIVIAFHAIRHPVHGLFLVDTGVERALRDDPEHAALHGVAARFLGVEKIHVRSDTASWIAAQKEPVKGVFLTHLHLDHVSGMRDVANDALVFTGPRESTERGFLNAFVRSPTDAALEGKGALQEWGFSSEGVVDVFGDGSVWAIHVPGHTAGSTAYLARTKRGAVLLTGDACHTAWGWEHGVEPGTYSADQPRSAESLERLRALVARHPSIDVRPGHQMLAGSRRADANADADAHADARGGVR